MIYSHRPTTQTAYMSYLYKIAALGAALLFSTLAAAQQPIGLGDTILQALKKGITSGGLNGAGLPEEITHLFLKSPYKRGAPLDNQFPRIAFTVLDAPPNHATVLSVDGAAIAKGCWKLRAVIWLDGDSRKDIPPFDACMPAIAQHAKVRGALAGYWDWWGPIGQIQIFTNDETTGSERTDGPKPPESPFPQGIKYLRYFNSVGIRVAPPPNIFEGYFWAVVLYAMDFDPTILHDRRVWIIKNILVEGE